MPALFWRVIFPNLPVPTGALGFEGTGTIGVHCTGIEMRGAIGSTNLIDGGGSFIGSSCGRLASTLDNNSIPNAFLPFENGRFWQSRAGLSGIGARIFPQWVGYRFAFPVEIEEITMTGIAGPFNSNMPHRLALQYSDFADGPWTTKYIWISGPWPWGVDGTDTRFYNATNAETSTIFNSLQAVTMLNRTAQEVRSSAMQSVSTIRRTAKVVSSRVEVISLIFIEDGIGIIDAPINIQMQASAVAFAPEIDEGGKKIILKRGPGIDLPGKPRRINSRSFLKGLDESELAFSDDQGRLFLGSDPARQLPQHRRLAYPYRNIEVIGENSIEAFSRMHGARMREGDNNDYILSIVSPSTTWQPIIEDAVGDPFMFPVGSLGAIVDYSVVDSIGKIVKQGKLQINFKSSEDAAECIDEFDVCRPAEDDPDDFFPEYDPTISTQLVKFRAVPVSNGLMLQYQSLYETPVRMRFKTSLLYFIPGRPITGNINANIVMNALILTPPEEFDYKFDFVDLPIMTDSDTFSNGLPPSPLVTSIAGNIMMEVIYVNQSHTFQLSTNYRESEIGFNAWGNWVTHPSNRFDYFWIRDTDRSGSMLIRLKDSVRPKDVRVSICGNRQLGGEGCDCILLKRDRALNTEAQIMPWRAVRNSTHSGFGVHGRILSGWSSRLFFFDFTGL